jgi:hypothetical protein
MAEDAWSGRDPSTTRRLNNASVRLEEGHTLPVKKTAGGYKYGSKGKTYKSKEKAEKQGRAIKASQSRRKKQGRY